MKRSIFVLVFVAATIGAVTMDSGSTVRTGTASAAEQERLPLTLFAMNRSLTRLAVIVAWDQGLYEKHGLKLNLIIPGPEFDGGKEIPPQPGMENAEPECGCEGRRRC